MNVLAYLIRFWRWLLARLGFGPQLDFPRAQIVEINPAREAVGRGQFFVVGGPGYQKWAYFQCPCGCGELIMLSLSQTRRPRWNVTLNERARPTVHPSVRQISGCYSHFWIRAGKVDWCVDTGRRPRGN